jgi:hypothetical protein
MRKGLHQPALAKQWREKRRRQQRNTGTQMRAQHWCDLDRHQRRCFEAGPITRPVRIAMSNDRTERNSLETSKSIGTASAHTQVPEVVRAFRNSSTAEDEP